MKKIVLIILFCGLAINGFSIVPAYHGARALSLGYASTAFNYDVNSMFINPSLLSSVNYSLSGWQYQHSYMDYKSFGDDLSDILANNLKNFDGLPLEQKSDLWQRLSELYQAKSGMYGFRSNVPGYIGRGYGLAVSMVKTAIMNPVTPDDPNFFNKITGTVTNADIASLKMSFLGLSYKKFTLSYAMPIMQSINAGVSVHYLNGKITEFSRSLMDDVFTAGSEPKDYLEYAWGEAETKFTKIVADVGLNADLGRYFKLGVVMKNFTGAKLKTPEREIELHKRVIAGLAFRPNNQWGFYVDMDLKAADLLYNGEDVQPISFGIEKGFFQNKFFLRAGMLNDISEKHFFGKKSNSMYGLGLGFNMKKFVVDIALGLDNGGTIKSLAISGFILVK